MAEKRFMDTLGPQPAKRLREAPAGRRATDSPPTATEDFAAVAARLRVALATLPDDPEGIALHLDSEGIRGETCNTASCPLTYYLSAVCGYPVVAGYDLLIATHEDWSLKVTTPRAVKGFMQGFDSAEWPYLIRPEAPTLSLVSDARKAPRGRTPQSGGGKGA